MSIAPISIAMETNVCVFWDGRSCCKLDGVVGVVGRRSTGRARRVGGETGVVHVDVLVGYAPHHQVFKTHAKRTQSARKTHDTKHNAFLFFLAVVLFCAYALCERSNPFTKPMHGLLLWCVRRLRPAVDSPLLSAAAPPPTTIPPP